MNIFEAVLTELKEAGLYRSNKTYMPVSATHVLVDDKKYLVLATNNYLGMTHNPVVQQAASDAIFQYGSGSGGARLTTGSHPLYEALEREIAAFKVTEAAIAFNTGYMANVGVISAVMGKGDIIFSDALNHASIIDGCRLSGAKCVVFKHLDMQDLRKSLRENSCYGRKLIVTDGVFSMDGDIAPVDELAAIAKENGALLMVDDAHATGVLGGGRGSAARFGLKGGVDIQMGTLSKALGAEGAYVAGSSELIEFLINKARSYIFSTALSPASIAAALASLRLIRDDTSYVERLTYNSRLMREALQDNGVAVDMTLDTPIIPIMIGGAADSLRAAKELYDDGIILGAIRPPTVPKGTSRLRIAVSAANTEWELTDAAAKIARAVKNLRG